MEKSKNIHNLDTLEKEIYRLKLKVKNIEGKLDDSFEHLRQNYSFMFRNSFFHKKKHKEEDKNGLFDSVFKNEGFNAAVNKVTDHVANRAAESIENLVDKIFHKRNKS